MTTTDNTAAPVVGEQRMLIDGKLVEARSGKLFTNVNPATEEILGQVADAGSADMDEAIGAARRAFDESAWATDGPLRQRCIRQLQAALEEERELLRAELVAEVGAPILLTYGPQLDAPLAEGLNWPANFIDEFPWERDLPEGTAFGTRSWRKVAKEPVGVVAAIVPWNYPFEVTVNKLGPALATGNTVILKAAPNTPWNATRIGRLVAERTDFPPGVLQVVTTSDNSVAEELVVDPRGRPHLLHRVHRGGPAHHGEGCPHAQTALPRARRQVGRHRARRRRLRGQALHGLDGVRPRRAGMRDAHPDAAAPIPI